MAAVERFDAIVIGSGQGGTPRDVIFAHPTLAEALNNLFDQ